MSDQNVVKSVNSPDIVEEIEREKNGTVSKSEYYLDVVPLDMAVIHETGPVGGIDPEDTSMEEAVLVVGPMGSTNVNEAKSDYFDGAILMDANRQAPPVGWVDPVNTMMEKAVALDTPVNKTNVEGTPMGEAGIAETPTGSLAALLNREDSMHFRTCWNEIQGKFVDEPRDAVQQADALVSEVIEQVTQMFAHEHNSLEGQWKEGKDVSTEDLRKALQHYRSFFNRLVV